MIKSFKQMLGLASTKQKNQKTIQQNKLLHQQVNRVSLHSTQLRLQLKKTKQLPSIKLKDFFINPCLTRPYQIMRILKQRAFIAKTKSQHKKNTQKIKSTSDQQQVLYIRRFTAFLVKLSLMGVCCFFGYTIFKFAYQHYEPRDPGRGPNIAADKFKSFKKLIETPWQSFIEKTIRYMRDVVKEVFADKLVNEQGVIFADRLLKHPVSHEAAVELMKNVLQDRRFIDASNVYGTDLIVHVLKTPVAQESFKQLILQTLKQEEVKSETVQLIKYIIEQQQSEEILAMFIQNLFLREDILFNLIQLLKEGSKKTFEDVPTQEAFVEFLLRVVRNRKLKQSMLEGLVYAPMKSFFSFGNSTTELSNDLQIEILQQKLDIEREESKVVVVEERKLPV